MPASLFHESFSSDVIALATINVQNGVVALSTEAIPAPSWVWPAKISAKGMTLLVSASRKNRPAWGSASWKEGPRRRRKTCSAAAAIATRNNTSTSGCISATAMRAKKNEPPQMAPSSRSWPQSLALIGPVETVCVVAVLMAGGSLPCSALLSGKISRS